MALVAYYPLNGDANDYSGNENHATNIGATPVADGKVGSCYEFNTLYSYQHTNTSIYMNTGLTTSATGTYTFSAWVSQVSNGVIVGYNPTIYNGFSLYISGTTAIASVNNNPQEATSSTGLIANGWNHLAATFDGNSKTIKLYINGELKSSDSWSGISVAAPIYIGTDDPSAPEWNYQGKIDEVRIYDHALSEFEIRELALFHPSANLVAHYPLDGDLLDYSGNNNHGVPSESNIVFEDGILNKSIKLNASTHYVTIAHSSDFDFGNKDFTFSYWIKTTSGGATGHIIDKVTRTPSLQGYTSWARTTGDIVSSIRINGATVSVTAAGFLIDKANKWVHIASIRRGNYHELYLNGIFYHKAILPSGTIDTNAPLLIGARDDLGSQFSGSIDDVRIYNKALSESEIKSLAQAKVAHYKLEDKNEEATKNLSKGIVKNWSLWSGMLGNSEYFVAPNGEYGVKVTTTTTGGSLWAKQNLGEAVSVLPSTNYTVSAIVKFNNGLDTNTFYIREYNSSGTQIKEHGLYSSSYRKKLNNDWYYIYRTFTTTSTTTSVRLESYIYSVNEIWMYNYQLEEKNNYTPFAKNVRQGPIIKDSTYNHNQGSVTLSTSPKWSSDTAIGLGSMEFDGIDDYIDTKNNFDSNSITLSAWIKPKDQGRYMSIIGKYRGNPAQSESYELLRSSNNGIRFHTNSSPIDSVSIIPNNEWTFICATYDGSNAKIFINGKLDASGIKGHNINTVDWNIGRSARGANYFKGNIADVQIFATALSDNDIYNLYVLKSKSIKFSSSSTSKILQSHTNKTIVPFTTVGTTNWTVPAGVTKVDALIVAGGGGGGSMLTASTSTHSGGGGAGGLLFKKGIPVTPGQVYPIVVGKGGSYDDGVYVSGSCSGESGGNSSAFGFTAIGGGGGAGRNTPAKPGGSGGGGSYTYPQGASGTPGQGYNGGNANQGSAYPSGSGGGAGGPGLPYDSLSNAGDGGPGMKFDISFGDTFGELGWFAGGGGGATTTPGAGGQGGGGDGSDTNGLDALPNTGGGGGGGGHTNYHGGNGGSGIVLIKYSTSNMNSKITK